SVSEDLFKVAKMKSLDLSKEKSKSVTNLITKDSYITKYTRLETKKDNHIKYDNRYINKYQESANKNNKYKASTVYDSRSFACSHEKLRKDKKKVIYPLVYNTRK
ncbi:6640_t:CDS:1, partial [Scutellospora calospora]